jgi:voltage-gated potassium channel
VRLEGVVTEEATEPMDEPRPSLRNEIFIVVLALISVLLLVLEVAGSYGDEDRRLLETIDLTIAFIFLGEFTIRFVRADDRKSFMKRHWWELLASIPITSSVAQGLRGLRLLRVISLLRLLRVVRFAARIRILLARSERLAGDTHLVALTTTVSVIVLSAALAFHFFEYGTNQNVHSLFDSFWWAMSTVTTVGYGDIYPVTTEGRLVAIFLMMIGIGTLGTFTALVARYVIRDEKGESP